MRDFWLKPRFNRIEWYLLLAIAVFGPQLIFWLGH